MNITQQKLKELFNYNPETGIFTRKTNVSQCKVGGVAGSDNGTGGIRMRASGKQYYAHQLAWLYIYGEWPINEIDHINHDRKDNRITNLRHVTHSDNQRNQIKARSNNKCGYLGVRLNKSSSKY